MIWWTFIIFLGTFIASELLRPKPKVENARPPGDGEFSFPTATEGRAVPLLWGLVIIKGANVVWYGQVRRDPITTKIDTGLFSSDVTLTTGYTFFVGLQFALCRGPGCVLKMITINDKILTAGTWASGTRFYVHGSTYNPPGILGGEFGSGDIEGYCTFYGGELDQAANSYLLAQQPEGVAYRGTSYLVFEGGNIGTSPSLAPWAFTVQRIPDGLSLSTGVYSGAELVNGQDANPMNVLYEIMTDTSWGLKIPVGEIDLLNFRAVAAQLAEEGNGFSFLLDSEMSASELVDEITRQIDGALFYDRGAGQWSVNLYRQGYTPADLLLLDESNIIELTEFSRQTWEETTNQVKLRYTDGSAGYRFKERYAVAQDMGNHLIQGGLVTSEVYYPGVKDAALANSLAWRDLRVLSYPLARVSLKANRAAYLLRPGSVFRLSWAGLGISEIVYRVGEINHGTLEDGVVTISAVEDIFNTGAGVFGDPEDTIWEGGEAVASAVDADDVMVFEVPRQMAVLAPDGNYFNLNTDYKARLFYAVRQPTDGTINFQVALRSGTTRPLTAAYVRSELSVSTLLSDWMHRGLLHATMPKYGLSGWPDDTNSFTVDTDVDVLLDLGSENGDVFSVENLFHIVRIDDEYIGFETFTVGAYPFTSYICANVYRGLFTSTQAEHAAGAKVWFIGRYVGMIPDAPDGRWLGRWNKKNLDYMMELDNQYEVDVFMMHRGFDTYGTAYNSTIIPITMEKLWAQPLPPRFPHLNGIFADVTAVSLDIGYATETGRSGEDSRALKFAVTPRAWRVDSPTADTTLDADYLTDTPTMDFDMVLDPAGDAVALPQVSVVSSTTPTAYHLRNDIIVALGAGNPIPATARVTVTPSHTPAEVGASISGTPLVHDFAIASSLQTAIMIHGGVGTSLSPAVTYTGDTGTYTFSTASALPSSGLLRATVNGGTAVDVIPAGLTTGTLALTSGDIVRLQVTQVPTADQFFSVAGPSGETGYGVLLA
jgi:hypothetical protein